MERHGHLVAEWAGVNANTVMILHIPYNTRDLLIK